jgi:HEAT repeat protein
MTRLHFTQFAFAAFMLGCLAFVVFHVGEPSCRGRTITKWSEIAFDEAHNFNAPDTNEIDSLTAIQIIGPKGIPTLLKFAQTKDSATKSKLISWLRDQDFLRGRIRIYDEEDRRNMASRGFHALGTNASPAIPALLNLLKHEDEDVRADAVEALNVVMPNKNELAVVLSNELHDISPHVKYIAALRLHNLDGQAADAAHVYQTFPELVPLSTPKQQSELASTN